MSVSKLPNGRWRAQVHHDGRNLSVAKILGLTGRDATFANKTEAKRAREKARLRLREQAEKAGEITVQQWRDTWTTDPLFRRPKDSTNIHNAERVKTFTEQHAHMQLADINDHVVAMWIRGGRNLGTIPALRAMFSDATKAKAGRLIPVNPFAGLGLARTKGNALKQPPSLVTVQALIATARDLSGVQYASWLEFAAGTGMRPGEVDALRIQDIDFEKRRVAVLRQWNATSRTFTLPKNGLPRTAILTPMAEHAARLALEEKDGDSEFLFTTTRRSHFTASARAYHWKAVAAKVDYTDTLYLATRHYAAAYMINSLLLATEDVAIALGHTDGGEQVRKTYGHRNEGDALARVDDAFRAAAEVVDLAERRRSTGA